MSRASLAFVFFATIAAVAGGCGGTASRPDGAAGDAGGVQTCGTPDEIYNISSQETLAALAGCTRLVGSLRVGDTGFSNLDGLESIRFIDGGLNLFRNRELSDIKGLRNLEAVGGTLTIHHHYLSLTSLDGLASLRSVGAEFFISNNSMLVTLAGLEQLRSVGVLAISANQSLQSLQALSGLETVAGDLGITLNPMLDQTEAEAFAAAVSVGGTITVSDNR